MKPYFNIAPMFELMKTARGIPALPECYLHQIPVKYLDVAYALHRLVRIEVVEVIKIWDAINKDKRFNAK